MFRQTFILILVSLICYCTANSLPDEFPRCSRNDPNLQKCLIKATQTVKPLLKQGISELGFPSLDPLKIPEVTLHQEAGAIKYTIGVTDLIINGLDEYKFKKLHYDTENYIITGTVNFENVFVRAKYDFDGSFFVAPLKGKGVLKAFTGAFSVSFIMRGDLKNINGTNYMKPGEAELKLNIHKGGGQFDGIINDNDELSQLTNRVLNDNAQTLIKEACPQITLAVRKIALEYWEQIFGQIPYDVLLPLSN